MKEGEGGKAASGGGAGDGEATKPSVAVSDMGAWGMNVVSSVGIIMANKQLMSSGGYGFSFGNGSNPRAFIHSSGGRSPLSFESLVCNTFSKIIPLGSPGSDPVFFPNPPRPSQSPREETFYRFRTIQSEFLWIISKSASPPPES